MGSPPDRRRASRPSGKSPDRADGLRPIEPGTLYPLAEFRRRTGWGRHAVRKARGDGLTVHRAGNRAYVLGRDFIDYVTGRPAAAAGDG